MDAINGIALVDCEHGGDFPKALSYSTIQKFKGLEVLMDAKLRESYEALGNGLV